MSRLLDKVVPLIAPALKEHFLLAFPFDSQPKTRIFFNGTVAEIEAGALGYYFAVKTRTGRLLASGAESTLHDALQRIFEKMEPHQDVSELPRSA
ncbi:MAG TPA: hypothetical protein VF493_07850 [Terriglobales bacterium]